MLKGFILTDVRAVVESFGGSRRAQDSEGGASSLDQKTSNAALGV